ncbi:uncharacterized protein LOC116352316 [Contarinia nasturtii]|uniref:uncharacterized protein LOC116352316 n=1 Tax=Contarinia nasturtii TaxID=265458 RepID=UPI0012D49804|nr:uncharacterized protein LOC116352316 [Contarinia nasturtii]
MKRRRAKINSAFKKNTAKLNDNEELRSIKLSAPSVFKSEYSEALTEHFFHKCYNGTVICYLGSTLFLYVVNLAADNDDRQYFIDSDGKNVIRECFAAVSRENLENPKQPKIPRGFLEMIADDQFEWPSRYQMGNAFEYLNQQYLSNVTTNLTTHLDNILENFLQMIRYKLNEDPNRLIKFDGIDIRNAKNNLMFNQDCTGGDQHRTNKMNELYEQVAVRCLPSFRERLSMIEYIEKKWFESLWFFIFIQREISIFLEEHHDLVQLWLRHQRHPLFYCKPSKPLPPKIRNFTVIPICDSKLKHIKFDQDDLMSLLAQWKVVPKIFNNDHGGHNMYSRNYYKENEDEAWAILFNMDKINEIKKPNQQFHHMIVCDSVSASVLYRTPKPEIENTELHRQRIKQKLENNEYKYIVAIDPGMKTYLAGIRRNIEDRTEENFKISSKSYHWGAGQKVRDKMGKRMTARFTQREQLDRESYPSIPSPRGIRWRNYVRHRLTMVKDAVAAYARRRYARLSFDKYIGSQGEKDWLAKVITKNEPSLINIGAVDMAPNSPIGIKKGKRCPGTRHLQCSVKKLGHSDVHKVNEDFTSQHCANCQKKFPIQTQKYRFKVCRNCTRDAPIPQEIEPYISLPRLIVTKKSQRRKKKDSCVKKLIARGIMDPANQPAEFQPGRLESKKMYFLKNWLLNPVNAIQMGGDADKYPEQQQQQQHQKRFD